jgi:hypothetical protein
MSRKTKHVPVSLYPLSVDQLPKEQILELELDHSPAYGAFRDLTSEDITARIDWLMVNDDRGIEYDHRRVLDGCQRLPNRLTLRLRP